MGVGNRVVAALLQSPAHRLLSGSVDLVRYTGRRTGRTITTPTQFARVGDHVVILVGRPDTKTWWRNFTDGRDLAVLLGRRWQPMRGVAVVGADDPKAATPLLEGYLDRWPKAGRALQGATVAEKVRSAVFVDCRPR